MFLLSVRSSHLNRPTGRIWRFIISCSIRLKGELTYRKKYTYWKI